MGRGLASTQVVHQGHAPTRWVYVLHGILGSGANWRTFCKRLAEAHPEVGFVLPDLREHGESGHQPGELTLKAAAADLERLEHALRLPAWGVMGHSFGGKVLMTWLDQHPGKHERAWVIDASPSARGVGAATGETDTILDQLERTTWPQQSRDVFVSAMRAYGHSDALVQWLAMNVRRKDGALELKVNVPNIRALLRDYYANDLWRVLETTGTVVDLYWGGRSPVYAEQGLTERLARLERSRAGSIRNHVYPEAGHWVHVDAPEALFRDISASLDDVRRSQ